LKKFEEQDKARMQTAEETNTQDLWARLNNFYRFQRHFYDVTPRFFLFGHDE